MQKKRKKEVEERMKGTDNESKAMECNESAREVVKDHGARKRKQMRKAEKKDGNE